MTVSVHSGRWVRTAGFALVLLVSACGGSSSDAGVAGSEASVADPTTTVSQTTQPPSTTAPPTTEAPSTTTVPPTTEPIPSFEVTTTAFTNGGLIPVEFTCDGEGTQPAFALAGLPDGTVSLAVIMDADVNGALFTHWVQFDMPPESEIPQDAVDVGVVGAGLFGQLGYAPPCPPSTGTLSTYTLQVFAVDSILGLTTGASKQKLLDELEGRVIGLGELTGTFSRS